MNNRRYIKLKEAETEVYRHLSQWSNNIKTWYAKKVTPCKRGELLFYDFEGTVIVKGGFTKPDQNYDFTAQIDMTNGELVGYKKPKKSPDPVSLESLRQRVEKLEQNVTKLISKSRTDGQVPLRRSRRGGEQRL